MIPIRPKILNRWRFSGLFGTTSPITYVNPISSTERTSEATVETFEITLHNQPITPAP